MRRPSGSRALLALADFIEPDGGDGAAQGLGIVAGVEVALGDVVEGHLLGPHQALEAQLAGLDADLAGQRIKRHLQREAHAGASHAAVGEDGRLVGGDRVGAAAVVREVVEARQDRAHLPRLQARRERIGRVGPGIDGRLAVERQQPAVRVGVGGQHVVMLAAVGVGGQVLAPVLDPLQRDAELARRPRQRHLLGAQDALVAEAAADIGRHHADLALVDAEAFGEAGADDVGLLRRGVHDELAEPRVPLRDHAAPLERAHDLARGPQLPRDGVGGLGFGCLEVRLHVGDEEQVIAPGLVHQRCAGLAAIEHVGHDGQRLEVELDRGRQILGLRPRRRDAHGHELADVAHLARGEDRLGRGLEARQRRVGADRQHAREVRGDEDAVAKLGRDADRLDARVCQRAAQERHLQHARQLDVADILAAPAHVAVVLLAHEPRADALVDDVPCHALLPRLFPTHSMFSTSSPDARRGAVAPAPSAPRSDMPPRITGGVTNGQRHDESRQREPPRGSSSLSLVMVAYV